MSRARQSQEEVTTYPNVKLGSPRFRTPGVSRHPHTQFPQNCKLPEKPAPASAPHVYQQSVPRLMVWWFKACEPRDAGESAARNSPTSSVTRYSMPHACARRGHYHRHTTSTVNVGYSRRGLSTSGDGDDDEPRETGATPPTPLSRDIYASGALGGHRRRHATVCGTA